MSRSSTSQSMEDLRFENPRPEWCSTPIALGVGRGSQRRVLYAPREILMLHSPVFERMLAEGNGFRESESGAVIELPDDDPEEFDYLLRFILHGISTNFHRALRLASKYLMEDAIRCVDSWTSVKAAGVSDLPLLIRQIDDALLPRTKAIVFRKVCTGWQLNGLRNHDIWEKLSVTLRLELTEHYYDYQIKAKGRGGPCSIDVPEIQWPNPLTFESPAPEHCGGIASLRLIVGRGKEKRVLHCSRELIFALFPALHERLHNDSDSLELEDDSADDFVHYMNWRLLKRPWEAFSAHQQSAMLCLASKYRGSLNLDPKIDFLKSLAPCYRLYLAEQCHLEDLQEKYANEIFATLRNLDEAKQSEWWPQLSAELRLSLYDGLFKRIDLSKIHFGNNLFV